MSELTELEQRMALLAERRYREGDDGLVTFSELMALDPTGREVCRAIRRLEDAGIRDEDRYSLAGSADGARRGGGDSLHVLVAVIRATTPKENAPG